MEENFGIFILIIPRPCWGAKFIIKESQLKQNLLFIINISACAKGKQKVISPPPNF